MKIICILYKNKKANMQGYLYNYIPLYSTDIYNNLHINIRDYPNKNIPKFYQNFRNNVNF